MELLAGVPVRVKRRNVETDEGGLSSLGGAIARGVPRVGSEAPSVSAVGSGKSRVLAEMASGGGQTAVQHLVCGRPRVKWGQNANVR